MHASSLHSAVLRIWWACTLLSGAGCDDSGLALLEGREIPLGQAEARIDLSRCSNTDCQWTTPRGQLVKPQMQSCTTLAPLPATPLWREQIAPPLPACTSDDPEAQARGTCGVGSVQPIVCEAIGPCLMSSFELAVAPDDSLWIMAIATGPLREAGLTINAQVGGVWLAHYTPDGARSSARMIEHTALAAPAMVYYTAEFAVDARGHPFVAIGKNIGVERNGWFDPDMPFESTYALHEFDVAGAAVGAPIEIEAPLEAASSRELRSVAVQRAGDAIALGARRFGAGGIGVLDPARRALRWSHHRNGRLGFFDLVGDRAGQVTLLTHSPDTSPSGRMEHYDAAGMLAWERVWSMPPFDGFDPLVALGVDRNDELLLTASTENWLQLYRLTPAADVVSFTHVVYPLWPNLSSFGRTAALPSVNGHGTAFIPGPMSESSESGNATTDIIEVSRDGNSCRFHRWEDPSASLLNLAAGAGDELYFGTTGGFGRFDLSGGPR
jgi:hypothetical protein